MLSFWFGKRIHWNRGGRHRKQQGSGSSRKVVSFTNGKGLGGLAYDGSGPEQDSASGKSKKVWAGDTFIR